MNTPALDLDAILVVWATCSHCGFRAYEPVVTMECPRCGDVALIVTQR